jgi:hypothetical protein
MRILQDYHLETANGKRNTIQFSVDILNLGNLLNSEWGVYQQPNAVQPLGVSVDNGVPTYTFDPDLTNTFGFDTSLMSRWQMQFGLRYIF